MRAFQMPEGPRLLDIEEAPGTKPMIENDIIGDRHTVGQFSVIASGASSAVKDDRLDKSGLGSGEVFSRSHLGVIHLSLRIDTGHALVLGVSRTK